MMFRLSDKDRALIVGVHGKGGAIYGGADASDYLEGARSMGELCVKRLTRFGEQVVLVSKYSNAKYRKF